MTGVCSVEVHEALKRDESAWRRLSYVGVQHVPADEHYEAEDYELRNCTCGSTLYRLIAPPAIEQTPDWLNILRTAGAL